MATQARAVLKIPARIVGAGNISVVLENGIYIISDAPAVTIVIVAELPLAVTMPGARRFVSDSMSAVFGDVVAGSGLLTVPVYSDGVSWRIG